MGVPSSGTLTFLFTDIERSTARWEWGSAAMAEALAAHDELLAQLIREHGGHVFKHTGDGVCALSESAQAAVASAIEAQEGLGLPVRMGVHTGYVEARGDDYFGPVLNRTARIMAAGHGGQILLSTATVALLEGVDVSGLGEHRLRDLAMPEHLFQVGTARFPPLATSSTLRTNVREPLTAFIGRERELAELGGLLGRHRLVTLTGVGICSEGRATPVRGAAPPVAFPPMVRVGLRNGRYA